VRVERRAGRRAGEWALFLWFLLGAFAMRSAGCAYNDIVDRDLDAQVERTRLRPLASGRVSVRRRAWALASACRWSGCSSCSSSPRRAGVALLSLARSRLSVHEAHHLVAAGVARAGVQLGRAGRLAGGDRRVRAARCCCGSAASSG
jgi:4-hydroxybenzoate polyprenyltransferase